MRKCLDSKIFQGEEMRLKNIVAYQSLFAEIGFQNLGRASAWFQAFLSSANEVSTGPTCQFVYLCLHGLFSGCLIG